MRKILWIVLVFISANLFAQDKNEFFVKNNGDTVYCKINSVDILSKGFLKKKKPKNELVYSLPKEGTIIISLDEVAGYKFKKQFYFNKIHLTRYKSTEKYKSDSIYDFFPKEDGRYVRGGVAVLNKDNIRFYRVGDVQNEYYVSAGMYGGYMVVPNAYYIETDNSGEAKELPTVTGKLFSKNNVDAWNTLKQYCQDDAPTVELIEENISKNKRCNDSNIEDVIARYVGKGFKDVPKQKI